MLAKAENQVTTSLIRKRQPSTMMKIVKFLDYSVFD